MRVDLLGKRFGRLVVIGQPETGDKSRRCLCRCDCGNTKRVQAGNLLSGATKSCGCYKAECRLHDAMKTGAKFGSLTILYQAETPPNRTEAYWMCQCDCGNTKIVRGYDLRKGYVTSCRQCGVKRSQEKHKTHGMAGDRLYKAWQAMKNRCNGKAKRSDRYLGRGITYAPEWETFEPFMEWALANGYDDTLELDRIDNDGNYEPSNCRWTTRTVQCRNTSRNVFVDYNGKRMCLAEAASVAGIPYKRLQNRIKSGWSVEAALTTPKIESAKKRSESNAG